VRESTAHSLDIPCFVPGIGAVTAAAVLTLIPEIGTLEREHVASLSGVAPFNRQSGHSQGKACI
jgi:transposase